MKTGRTVHDPTVAMVYALREFARGLRDEDARGGSTGLRAVAHGLPGSGHPEAGWGRQQNTGPDITINTPHPGDRVAISQFFSLSVEDVNGVQDVTLSCGDHVLRKWTQDGPLYQEAINLGICRQGVSVTGGDAGAFQTISLKVSATDKLGAASTAPLTVTLDANVASVVVGAPPRVAPGAQFTITVQSDQDLVAPPQVLVDGVPVSTASTDGGQRSFASTATAPGLGVERGTYQSDGGDVPLEVLEEIERQLPVTVDATSSSGIVTHQDSRVLLSRIAWQSAVPGQVILDVTPAQALPEAFSEGLQVPISTNLTDGYGSVWVPVFFDAEDGTATPFRSLENFIPSLLGYRPFAFDSAGRTLLIDSKRVTAFVDSRNSRVLSYNGSQLTSPATPPLLTQVSDSLCWDQAGGGACAPTRSVQCLNADGGLLSIPLATADNSQSYSPLITGSGSVFVGANAPPTTCFSYSAELVIASLGGPASSIGSALPDAGTKFDAGTPVDDDAGTPSDAGTQFDAGTPVDDDAGIPVDDDAGIPVDDDAGTPVEDDAGTPVKVDAGTQMDGDAGGPPPAMPDGGTVPFGFARKLLPVGDGTFVVVAQNATPTRCSSWTRPAG